MTSQTTFSERGRPGGDPSTGATDALWAPLQEDRGSSPQLHVWSTSGYRPLTWDDWRAGAEASARGLRRAGIRRGSRVAAVLTNTFEAATTVIGAWLTGATLVSLPTQPRGATLEQYLDLLSRACRTADAELLLLEGQYADALDAETLGTPVASFESLLDQGPFDAELPDDDDVVFVQFSSGSTREPRGCMLTARAIAAQLEMLRAQLDMEPGRRGVSWLPLSHDMGLFGALLLSWTSGGSLALGTPERFLRSPRTWLADCADFQATDTVGPTFALGLATRAALAAGSNRPFPLRELVLGGERIDWGVVTEAVRVLEPCGVTYESIRPAYGLAEATLGVTCKPSGTATHALAVDRRALLAGAVDPRPPDHSDLAWIVSCGFPLPGVQVQAGSMSEPARIQIQSPSLACGYLGGGDDAGDGEGTTAGGTFHDDAFITEDLGLLHDGELYVLGRTDDVLNVGGRKFHARDVESLLCDVPGVRAGCCVLIDIPGPTGDRPSVVAVAEPDTDTVPAASLAPALKRMVYETAGIRLTECVLVTRGSLPKTPSGKVQRFRCREMVVGEAPAILERVRC
jgi:fatty-acyl-CoA synthase